MENKELGLFKRVITGDLKGILELLSKYGSEVVVNERDKNAERCSCCGTFLAICPECRGGYYLFLTNNVNTLAQVTLACSGLCFLDCAPSERDGVCPDLNTRR